MPCQNCSSQIIGPGGSAPLVPVCQSFATNQVGHPGELLTPVPPAGQPYLRVSAGKGGKFEKTIYVRTGALMNPIYQQYVIVSEVIAGTVWTPGNDLDFVDDLVAPAQTTDPGDWTVRDPDAYVNSNADCDSGSPAGPGSTPYNPTFDDGDIHGDLMHDPHLFDSGVVPGIDLRDRIWRVQTVQNLASNAGTYSGERFTAVSSGVAGTVVSFSNESDGYWMYFTNASLGGGRRGLIPSESIIMIVGSPPTLTLANPHLLETVE